MMWIYVIPGQLSRRVQKRELTYKIGRTGQYKASANFRMSSLLKKSQQKLTIVYLSPKRLRLGSMKTIVCFHPSGYSRLGLLESSGGRRRILPSLTQWDILRREKFMVCREGRAKEREAREEPAAFTGERLRRIRNRHVRRPQK